MRRIILSALAALTLGGTLTACYGPETVRGDHERREERVYRDREGRLYRRARWNNEDVYRREDGRWYARRGENWEVREKVYIAE